MAKKTPQQSRKTPSASHPLVYTDIIYQTDTSKGQDTSSSDNTLHNNIIITEQTSGALSLSNKENSHNGNGKLIDDAHHTAVPQKRGVGYLSFVPSGLTAKIPKKDNPLFRPGCPRGKKRAIAGYSSGSQTRFMQFLMSLDLRPYLADEPNRPRGRGFFVTLTYHHPVENDLSRTHFHTLCNGMVGRQRDGEENTEVRWIVWKKEPQARGVIHYHLLIGYDTSQEKNAVQEWVQRRWDKVVESHNRVQVMVAYASGSGSGGGKNTNPLIFYFRKGFEPEKPDEQPPEEADSMGDADKGKSNGIGRMWGKCGQLPKKQPLRIRLESEEERAGIFAWIRKNGGKYSSYLAELSDEKHGFSVPSNGEEMLAAMCEDIPWLNDRVKGTTSTSHPYNKNNSFTLKRPLPSNGDPFDFYKAFPDERCGWKQLANRTRPFLSKVGWRQVQAGWYLIDGKNQMGAVVWAQWVAAEFAGQLKAIEPAIQAYEKYLQTGEIEIEPDDPLFLDETAVAIQEADSSQEEVDYPEANNNAHRGEKCADNPEIKQTAEPNETAVPTPNNDEKNITYYRENPKMPITTNLLIEQIQQTEATQCRVKLDDETVDRYAEDMTNGHRFPPLVVFHDGQTYWLADGYHRIHAALKMGWAEIICEVRDGGLRNAILYAVEANTRHGLNLSNADKRNAVAKLLADEEWRRWSNREIANKCGVSHTLVGDMKRELSLESASSEHDNMRKYTNKYGETAVMNVGAINQGRQNGSPTPNTLVSPLISQNGLEDWPAALQKGLEEGDIGRKTAEAVLARLATTHAKIKALASQYLITDSELLPLLDRLCRHRSETFDAICQSGAVPLTNGEMIPLAQATVRDLRGYLAEAHKEHKRAGGQAKQERAIEAIKAGVSGLQAEVIVTNQLEDIAHLPPSALVLFSPDEIAPDVVGQILRKQGCWVSFLVAHRGNFSVCIEGREIPIRNAHYHVEKLAQAILQLLGTTQIESETDEERPFLGDERPLVLENNVIQSKETPVEHEPKTLPILPSETQQGVKHEKTVDEINDDLFG